ncbi:MAG: MFS transporter [Gammaproteobacteria bacterium]|nr:MFS transporter [Gammaproteobacteria bacterium]
MKIKYSTLDFLKTSFGNILEWYDFSLYGIFATSIAHSFFPSSDPFVGLLMVFLAFSASFIARPLGSIIFGYIGDKFGKHYSVNITVWFMAIPTVVVAFLPTYQQIGIIAPITLVSLRILQGISVGGQLSGLITIAVDDGEKGKRSFLVSMVLSIVVLGCLLASIIGLISQATIGHFSKELAWRIPFALSGVLFILYLKLKPDFKKHTATKDFHLKAIFKNQASEVIYMTTLAALMACVYYAIFSYFVTYLEIYVKAPKHQALIAINTMLVSTLIGYMFWGRFADKVANRISMAKKIVSIFCLGVVLLSVSNNYMWVVSCFFLMAMAYCGLASHLTGMYAEIFDPKYRMTACSLCYSGGAIFGGFSPFLSEVLAAKTLGGFFMYLLCLGFGIYLILDKIVTTYGYKKYISPSIDNADDGTVILEEIPIIETNI